MNIQYTPGIKGIRQWHIIYIPNDNTQNYPFARLHLVVEILTLNLMNQKIKIQ